MNNLTIPAYSEQAAQAVKERLDSLAKVPGSLGKLEELAIRLAGITGRTCPSFPQKSVVLFAADHDITLKGVSATGQEVTEIQVRNFLKGGGTINAFCRNAGASLTVVDVGIKGDVGGAEGLVRRKVVHAARDFSEGPAMTREEALACVQVGIDMAREEAARGVTLLAAGEMGIGNTTTSAAVLAALTHAPAQTVTGRGGGLTDAAFEKKKQVIDRALDAGYKPVSLLMERKQITGPAAGILSRCGDAPVYTADREMLAELTGFELTRGVLCAFHRPAPRPVEELCKNARRVAVLEGIVDPTNVGAIFRSAAALNMDAVLIHPSCCDPLSRRAVRVSMGTVFQVPWGQLGETPADWPEKGMDILHSLGFKTAAMALSDRSVSIDDEQLAKEPKLAIVLGTEGDGLAPTTIAACDYTVRIPMTHGVDSLNVAAASAVAFYQLGLMSGGAPT